MGDRGGGHDDGDELVSDAAWQDRGEGAATIRDAKSESVSCLYHIMPGRARRGSHRVVRGIDNYTKNVNICARVQQFNLSNPILWLKGWWMRIFVHKARPQVGKQAGRAEVFSV